MSISRPGRRRQPSPFTDLRTGVPFGMDSVPPFVMPAGSVGLPWACRILAEKSAAAVGQPFRGDTGKDDEQARTTTCVEIRPRAAKSRCLRPFAGQRPLLRVPTSVLVRCRDLAKDMTTLTSPPAGRRGNAAD